MVAGLGRQSFSLGPDDDDDDEDTGTALSGTPPGLCRGTRGSRLREDHGHRSPPTAAINITPNGSFRRISLYLCAFIALSLNCEHNTCFFGESAVPFKAVCPMLSALPTTSDALLDCIDLPHRYLIAAETEELMARISF